MKRLRRLCFKIDATRKNNYKMISDDTRLLAKMSWNGKTIGTIALHAIFSDTKEGYQLLWHKQGRKHGQVMDAYEQDKAPKPPKKSKKAWNILLQDDKTSPENEPPISS